MKRYLPALAFAIGALWSAPALGDDPCVPSYDSSQRLRRAGKLVEAKKALLTCAQQECPAPVAKECTRWLREVTESLPTVVFGARDEHGQDLLDVRVYDGDELLADKLDGRAVFVNPGQHEFRYEFADGKQVTEKVLIREAEKNRALTATRPAPPAPRKDEVAAETKPAQGLPAPPAASWALGALGVLGLASFGYFALDARAEKSDLQDSCAPDCTESQTAPLRHKALAADISLGVGLAALAGGTWLWLSYDPDPSAGALLSARVGGRF